MSDSLKILNFNTFNTFRTTINPKLDNPNNIKFHWNLLYMCNYKCSFCYARTNQWNTFSSKSNINNTINFLSKVNHKFEIYLLGGEPSIYIYLDYVLTELRKLPNLDKITIISNGEKLIKSELLKYVDNIYLSFYPFATTNEKFYNSLLYYKQYCNTFTTFLFDNKYQEQHLDYIKFCKENNIEFYGNFIFNKNKVIQNNKKEFDLYLDLIYKYLDKNLIFDDTDNVYKFNEIDNYRLKLNTFKDWYCDNKIFDIPVKFDGLVEQFCSEKKFNLEQLNTYISENKLYKCELEQCVCPARNNCCKFKVR